METRIFIFECSTATYLDCVQKGLFGSNLPWPLQIKTGDYCCLYHYEVGTMFGLWQGITDGGKNLVPKAWGGRFPFQVKVSLVTPEIIAISKAEIGEAFLNPASGKFENIIEGKPADDLLRVVQKV
jgi:Development and cell death domain